MSNEIVEVLNTETGDRGQIRRKHFDNPRINNGVLVEVDASQKPYVSEMYKSKLGVNPQADHDGDVEDDVEDYDKFLDDTNKEEDNA